MARYDTTQRIPYPTNGSAAYDYRRYGSAAPQQVPHRGLPEERRRPEPVRRVRAKLAVAPFALLGMAAALGMLILVVFSYVQLYEAKSRVSQLDSELAALQQEQQTLSSQFESQVDLAAVEQRALELGMVQASSVQTVYLNLSDGDRGEVVQQDSDQASLVERFCAGVERLVSYLS